MVKKIASKEKNTTNINNGKEIEQSLYGISTIRMWANFEGVCDFRKHPERLRELIQALKEYGYHDHVIDVGQFCLDYRLSPDKFRKWTLKFPELHDAYKGMKDLVHVRRRMKWGGKAFDKDCFLRYAHHYEPEEKKFDEYHDARINKQSEDTRELLKEIVGQVLKPFEYKKDEDN